jgi:hypothetical protein
MQGCKLLEIEGSPKLAIFELRGGRYWDGIQVTRMDDGVTLQNPDVPQVFK